ncbi:MAG: NAD(P)-binding domain-containing protein [Myxococcales bacterium]|nr:NAD(P)-binding domain-containing protein [Myxococcales bacterium]
MSPPVAVLGGGSFGQGLARAAARVGQRVLLWSRRERAELGEGGITCTTELSRLAEAELLLFAVPSPYVGGLADALGRHLDGSHLLVHVSRGLVGDELHTVSEVLGARTPCRRVGALAGPLVASGLARGEPGGAIIGSHFPEVIEAVSDAIGGAHLRVYGTDDLMGVEIASALVGLVALTLGYAQQLGMGPGTLAVLGTRGLAEATRVGEVRGALARTFAGLAGAGDLVAAVAGDGRPELEFGKALALGLDLSTAAERAGAYIEGGALAGQVSAFGVRYGVQVPIADGLARLMKGQLSVAQLTEALMARPATRE